ncbi:spore coat protein YlbD [Bacillaceae bacterium W0354]
MDQINLPDEVRQFKQFVHDKQKLREDVKNKKYTWQQLFNIWKDRGEDDPFWDEYRESSTSNKKNVNGTMQKLMNAVSNIDVDSLEKQVHSLSKTIDEIQKLFKNERKQPPTYQKRRYF